MSVHLVDDYQRQLRILDALRSESQAVRGRFDAARQQYGQQIRQSHQLGYMGDYVDQLEQRFREFSTQMDAMLETLARGELRIVEQEQRLHSLIARAQSEG